MYHIQPYSATKYQLLLGGQTCLHALHISLLHSHNLAETDVLICLTPTGGDNIGNGNQVADGAVSLGGKAISGSDSTSGGQANGGTNSITGRRSLLTWGSSSNPKPSNPVPTNNIACSTGFTAVKSGAGTVCIQSADGMQTLPSVTVRYCQNMQVLVLRVRMP